MRWTCSPTPGDAPLVDVTLCDVTLGIEAYVTPETARQDKTRVHWGTEA